VSKNPAPTGSTTDVELDAGVVARVYAKSGASKWAISEPAFRVVLARSAAKTLGAGAREGDRVERYVSALHLEDLALAAACESGNDAAWDHFVLEFRPVLYRAADALSPGGGARELADAIYADLYGLQERDGERRSLLRYFHGRSSLATWLRAVLAQRHVDAIRSSRRLEPIEDEGGTTEIPSAAPAVDPDRHRFLALVKVTLLRAIASLPDRDRLRLGCYYRENLTLAQIGRLLKEHEATVSRQLARTRRTIRADVERLLRAEHGMSDAAIAQCFESTIDDPGTLDVGELLGNSSARKDSEPERSI
jgi:RNA polymerase sigma-70 factor (ECF subfamily)